MHSATAVEAAGGPKIDMKYGRVDTASGDDCTPDVRAFQNMLQHVQACLVMHPIFSDTLTYTALQPVLSGGRVSSSHAVCTYK